MQDALSSENAQASERTLICTSVTATSTAACIEEIREAHATGVDLIELRLDFIQDFDTPRDLEPILQACSIPYIVTYRPVWEGGNYDGPEPQRLATLKLAAMRGAPYVDVEFKAAHLFFAGRGEVPPSTRVILSSHDFGATPPTEELRQRAADMWAAGADVVKIAAMANDICDCAALLSLLQHKTGPTIALAMGDKGVITRVLAAKYGGHLTFAALSAARASAPGQPTIEQLRGLYRLGSQSPATKVFGIVGNPVHHSKSPLIHNSAFSAVGFDGVYVPLLVDDLHCFLDAFSGVYAFEGLSVTIPHKEAALQVAREVDPVAAQIGAINTLIRVEGGGYRGYNTDCSAAVGAIERALASRDGSDDGASTSGSGSDSGSSPLAGRTVVVVGAGGAGRALAFGCASMQARVLIANRNRARADALAASLPSGVAQAVDWETLQRGEVRGDVLVNTTSVGMVPDVEATPVAAPALAGFSVVFDAVYTPRWTRLLRDARDAGCTTVDGVQMFVAQAMQQFELFTHGLEPPAQVMEGAVLGPQQQ